MEQTRYVNLPVIGRIQHGERTDKKVTELGYFIAKVEDAYMQAYLNKFDELYKGKQSIDIAFFNEQPLTMKYARYNQSGEVCYCMTNSNTANQKTKNGWQAIQCNSDCQYRQKNEYGKAACNRIGWLKFLIPSVCKDRIFLMRITGQTSLNRLDDYFNLQKAQGNSIKGNYTIFLKQEEQSNSLGKTFNNYVLDILKKEDFISTKQIPKTNEKPKELSTKNDQSVNNNVIKEEKNPSAINTIVTNKENEVKALKEKTTKKTTATKETTKQETKSKAKKSEVTEAKEKTTAENNEVNLDNCYALLRTFTETLANKEYLIGEFADMKDQISNIVIRPEDATELAECDLGTFVKLDVAEIKGRKFAMKLEFIEKTLKKVAA
jgi:hypothetical protein